MWGLVQSVLCGPYRVHERPKRVVLTMEITKYISVYSIMSERKYYQIVVDKGIQIHIQENTAYDDK